MKPKQDWKWNCIQNTQTSGVIQIAVIYTTVQKFLMFSKEVCYAHRIFDQNYSKSSNIRYYYKFK